MTTQDKLSQTITIEVSAERFQFGTWCDERNRNIDKGDIAASYSADVIAFKGWVRKPFLFRGALYVSIGGANERAEAYQLQDVDQFGEPTMTYNERVGTNNPRNHPYGFYHGMLVRYGKKECVLVGPSTIFQASNEPVMKQGDLF